MGEEKNGPNLVVNPKEFQNLLLLPGLRPAVSAAWLMLHFPSKRPSDLESSAISGNRGGSRPPVSVLSIQQTGPATCRGGGFGI